MYRKKLQIETNFLEQEDPTCPIVTTSKINYGEKLSAATLFEKSLSMILARNFIECWKELKSNEDLLYTNKKVHKVLERRIDQNAHFGSGERYLTTQILKGKSSKRRSHSQAHRYLRTQRSVDVQEEQYRIKRNRSVRVINQQIQNSRASILKEIVEKLRNAKKICQEDDDVNHQVLRRIGHLEKMIRQLKQSQQSKINIYKTTSQNNYSHHRSDYKHRQLSPERVYNAEQEELIKQLTEQIQIIKKQVTQIKANNELILKTEIERSERSRVSYNSEKYKIKSGQDQCIKDVISEGVQTTLKKLISNEIEEKNKNLGEEGEMYTKATLLTNGNGSHLGVSGVQSRGSDKYLLNQFQKYSNLNPPNLLHTKISPIAYPPTTSIFTGTRPLMNNGIYNRPQPITISPPLPQSSSTYTFQPLSSTSSYNPPFPSKTIPFRSNIPYQYPKLQPIKTTSTFQNRSTYVENPLNTLIGVSFNQPPAPYTQNHSKLVHQQVRTNASYSNYCSACGRNCGCARVFPNSHRF